MVSNIASDTSSGSAVNTRPYNKTKRIEFLTTVKSIQRRERDRERKNALLYKVQFISIVLLVVLYVPHTIGGGTFRTRKKSHGR